ncbi:hypothetical protein BGX31_010251 [Mortierella sp. GBA43]|nr:hypothetical protein BGX31_010251 [Mortierella sp. GBA43]
METDTAPFTPTNGGIGAISFSLPQDDAAAVAAATTATAATAARKTSHIPPPAAPKTFPLRSILKRRSHDYHLGGIHPQQKPITPTPGYRFDADMDGAVSIPDDDEEDDEDDFSDDDEEDDESSSDDESSDDDDDEDEDEDNEDDDYDTMGARRPRKVSWGSQVVRIFRRNDHCMTTTTTGTGTTTGLSLKNMEWPAEPARTAAKRSYDEDMIDQDDCYQGADDNGDDDSNTMGVRVKRRCFSRMPY